MNRVYNRIVENAAGERTATRLTEILVKSAIAWPADKTKLPAGRHRDPRFRVDRAGFDSRRGGKRRRGRSWAPAKLDFPPKPLSWVRWKYSWLGCAWRTRADEPRHGFDRQDPASAARSRAQGRL